MVRLVGLEPTLSPLSGECFNQLSHKRMVAALSNALSQLQSNGFTDRPVSLTEYAAIGLPGVIRTLDILLPRQVRYQAALQVDGGDAENRTPVQITILITSTNIVCISNSILYILQTNYTKSICINLNFIFYKII